jgi:hypothetical protein
MKPYTLQVAQAIAEADKEGLHFVVNFGLDGRARPVSSSCVTLYSSCLVFSTSRALESE